MTNEPSDLLIRDAFKRFGKEYLSMHQALPIEREKAVFCITNCKTGSLGYNVSECENCGKIMIHANSCNNRVCPCCQAALTKKWELERNTELIEGIAYYHVIFTVPHELNPVFQDNETVLLNLLFQSVRDTVLTLCSDRHHLGAVPGIIAVLHTWGQKLNYHPHLHLCISGGGLTPEGKFIESKHKGFFLPEAAAASMFRGKFLCSLKKLYQSGSLRFFSQKELSDSENWKSFIDRLFSKRWLPFIKETFNGRGNAVRYLARYSYRSAISNSRIVSVDEDTVTFRYKDYADENHQKTLTVKGTDFIDLFLQHVLPSGFHRVRFYGYLSNAGKTKKLKLIHRLRNSIYAGDPYRSMKTAELLMALYGKDICHCPVCSGVLISYPRGMPANRVQSLLNRQKPVAS